MTDNLSLLIYLSKIENRMTYKSKTGYHLELLTLETMILLESTKNWKIKGDNVENVLHLRNKEIVLAHRNIINNNYQDN